MSKAEALLWGALYVVQKEAEHKAWLLKTFKCEYPLILASENLSPEMEAMMPQLAAIPGVTVKRSKYLKAGEVYSMNNHPLFPPSPTSGHADAAHERKDGEK